MHAKSGDPVPAIREEDATGEIAAIYADLRATLAVPVVNLIWRHLAITPGALPWAWAAVRPLYVSGAIAAEAAALRGSLRLPDLPAWPREALAAAGVSSADMARIGTVLDSYHRSNAMNLIALSALLMALDDERPAESAASVPAPDQGVDGSLPKLLTLDEMAPATARLVETLNMVGERGGGRILASMYRHLAQWPGFLALTWTLIAPVAADGRLAPAIEDGLRQGRRRAAGLIGGLGRPATGLDMAAKRDLRTALDDFTTHPIGKMVTICALVRSAMPSDEAVRV